MSYAYSVAIKLSVANFASQGLQALAQELRRTHGAAVSLQDKLKALKTIALGFGLERVGKGILGGIGVALEASKEYTRQLSLMNAAGMTQAEIAASVGSAWKTTGSVITSTAAENLRWLRELRSLFGDSHMGEAYAVLPTVARTSAAMSALTGKGDDRLAFEMAKVAELRQTGVMTLPFLTRNMELLSKTLLAMGGTIGASDYLMTLKYSKTAALGFDDRFVYDYLPTLIQETKGGGRGASIAGTALMTLFTNIVQGSVHKAAVPVWEAMGLFRASDVVANATGAFQLRPGAVAGSQLFMRDPLAWAEQYGPRIHAYGAAHHLTDIQAITAMGLPRNAAWMLSTLMLKAPQFERDRQLIEGTPSSLSAYNALLKTNPQLAEQALHAQWQNSLAIIGYQIMPVLVPLMVKFSNGLSHLAQFMQRHPTATKLITEGLIGVAASLVVLGDALMTVGIVRLLGAGPLLKGIATGNGPSTGGFLGKTARGLGRLTFYGALFETLDELLPDSGGWRSLDSWSSLAKALGMGGGQSYAQPSDRHGVIVRTQVNLDGRKIGEAVSKHQGRASSNPQTGVSGFNGVMTPVPAGATGSW